MTTWIGKGKARKRLLYGYVNGSWRQACRGGSQFNRSCFFGALQYGEAQAVECLAMMGPERFHAGLAAIVYGCYGTTLYRKLY